MENSWWEEKYNKYFTKNNISKLKKIELFNEENWRENFKNSFHLRNSQNWKALKSFSKTVKTIDNSLKILSLNHSKCALVSPMIIKFKNLKELSIYDFQISFLPEFLKQLDLLISLTIRRCPIIDIPIWIDSFTLLENLDISRCRIKNVPEELKNCLNLKNLTICRNEISKIPLQVFKLKKLRVLDVSYNSNLNIEWENNSLQLNILYISGTKINKIPESISNNLLSFEAYSMKNILEIPKMNQDSYYWKYN